MEESHSRDRNSVPTYADSCRSWQSRMLFRQRCNSPCNCGAYMVMLRQLIPCAFHVDVSLSCKFGGDPITRRGTSLAVLVQSSRKCSLQVSADWALHIYLSRVLPVQSSELRVVVQKMLAISIVVMRRPWSECSRVKSSRKLNLAACGPSGVISELLSIGARPTFRDECRLFSEPGDIRLPESHFLGRLIGSSSPSDSP